MKRHIKIKSYYVKQKVTKIFKQIEFKNYKIKIYLPVEFVKHKIEAQFFHGDFLSKK